jgi:hypothetical protein
MSEGSLCLSALCAQRRLLAVAHLLASGGGFLFNFRQLFIVFMGVVKASCTPEHPFGEECEKKMSFVIR